MSANNVIWLMNISMVFHVWYSGCYDKRPKEPDRKAFGWRWFKTRERALVYAHDLVKYIEEEWSSDVGKAYVEYGVVEL